MKARIVFAMIAAGFGMLLAGVPPAQPHRVGPAEIYPDPVKTPGAANPQVTQQNIQDTICNPHWSTKLIRPPAEYTSRLKRKQLREYGDTVHQRGRSLSTQAQGRSRPPGAKHIPTAWPATRKTTLFRWKMAEIRRTRGISGPSHLTPTWAA